MGLTHLVSYKNASQSDYVWVRERDTLPLPKHRHRALHLAGEQGHKRGHDELKIALTAMMDMDAEKCSVYSTDEERLSNALPLPLLEP